MEDVGSAGCDEFVDDVVTVDGVKLVADMGSDETRETREDTTLRGVDKTEEAAFWDCSARDKGFVGLEVLAADSELEGDEI